MTATETSPLPKRHKLVGYKNFKRSNPKTDNFRLHRFHHIEFWYVRVCFCFSPQLALESASTIVACSKDDATRTMPFRLQLGRWRHHKMTTSLISVSSSSVFPTRIPPTQHHWPLSQKNQKQKKNKALTGALHVASRFVMFRHISSSSPSPLLSSTGAATPPTPSRASPSVWACSWWPRAI